MESFSLWLYYRCLNEGTERRRARQRGGIGSEEERKKGGRKKSVFHPHDTATGGLLDFRRAAAPVSYGWKVEKDKKEKAEGWWRGRGASPTRVLFRIRARHRAPLLLGCILSPSQQASSLSLSLSSLLFSPPLLDESARHLITQHYPPSSATPSFPPPLAFTHHPSTSRDVRPLYPPTQAIPRPPLAALASRPRNIKPTPPYFPSDSMESP